MTTSISARPRLPIRRTGNTVTVTALVDGFRYLMTCQPRVGMLTGSTLTKRTFNLEVGGRVTVEELRITSSVAGTVRFSGKIANGSQIRMVRGTLADNTIGSLELVPVAA